MGWFATLPINNRDRHSYLVQGVTKKKKKPQRPKQNKQTKTSQTCYIGFETWQKVEDGKTVEFATGGWKMGVWLCIHGIFGKIVACSNLEDRMKPNKLVLFG